MGTKKKKKDIRYEMMGSRDWTGRLSKMLLTCEIIFLRHVVPRKERYFDVVHINESVVEKENRDGHTTG